MARYKSGGKSVIFDKCFFVNRGISSNNRISFRKRYLKKLTMLIVESNS